MQRICADSVLMRFTLHAMLHSDDANESSFFLEKRKKNKTEMTFRLIGWAKYDKIAHSLPSKICEYEFYFRKKVLEMIWLIEEITGLWGCGCLLGLV